MMPLCSHCALTTSVLYQRLPPRSLRRRKRSRLLVVQRRQSQLMGERRKTEIIWPWFLLLSDSLLVVSLRLLSACYPSLYACCRVLRLIIPYGWIRCITSTSTIFSQLVILPHVILPKKYRR
ncbi:hypothetical protein F5148DRAFT_261759 [Russula earlei]|uniref:Uncharacterized protein n=1 Tax=Russula earlei TaxID=71964 RepID=A0ACC0UJ02_9AGAM|nr:hypothetical protein F5148DRAFT_261759 [Russula earlei]